MAKPQLKKRETIETNSNNRIDMILLITVLLLLSLGLVMVLSASAPSALAKYNDSYKYFKTQAVAAILGLVLMTFVTFMPLKGLKKHYKIWYVIGVLLLFTVKIPKIGLTINGANRWINVGIQIQPSEITKILLILFFAGYYTDKTRKFDSFWEMCLLPMILTAIPVLILYKVQDHLSAGIIITLISIVMMFMAGCKWTYIGRLLLLALGFGGIGYGAIHSKISSGGGTFRTSRVQAWLDPWNNYSTTAYQTIQGLYAIGSGGLFGVGLGKSKQKYLYIPEAHNDFIFAILAEELGFVGCTFVLILFAVFTVRGVLISIRARNLYESLIAIGITTLIATQAILNIAVVTNSIPNTGISLPLLSYGGTSLIILLASIGLLLNVSRNAKKA